MKGYVGWLLPEPERAKLLGLIPPVYPDVIAHHVTLAHGVDEADPLPTETSATVVGVTDDREGIQTLVVEIGGTTDRPDGWTYHITWSLDREHGYTAKMSKDAILACGWTPVTPIPVALRPMFFPFGSSQ